MTTKKSNAEPSRVIVGWREWVSFPTLGVDAIKAKLDTGARTSSLHVTDLCIDDCDDGLTASFTIHPIQRQAKPSFRVQTRVHEFRSVRSSNGHSSERPVIITPVRLGGGEWPIELTLTARDEMGFRLLLGRQALWRRFLISPDGSFMASADQRHSKVKKSKNRK